jgi:L-malate glycosyltransferase
MRKILVIMNGLLIGGAEIQTISLINGLSERDFVITLISLDNSTTLKNKIFDNIDVEILGRRSFLDMSAIRKIRSIIKDFKPDFLIMVNSYSMLYGYLAQYFLNMKTKNIMINHTTKIVSLKERIKNIIYRRIMNKMDLLVYVCNNQRNYWVRKYRIKQHISGVIYNGIDIVKFSGFTNNKDALRKKLGFGKDDIVVGICANLKPEKKHEDLIEALTLMDPAYPIKLLFIGGGPRRKSIEEYATDKKVLDRLVITGTVEDIRPYLSIVDILVLTSCTETLSMAILEGMAMRKPVILSDIGGASELVESGVNGFLYMPGDAGALSGCLKQMIDDDSLVRMGEESFIKAEKYFKLQTMIDKYENLIISVGQKDAK